MEKLKAKDFPQYQNLKKKHRRIERWFLKKLKNEAKEKQLKQPKEEQKQLRELKEQLKELKEILAKQTKV